jgi:gliding motility-associated-like protein
MILKNIKLIKSSRKLLFLLIVILGFSEVTNAQNLIADSGFEIWNGTIGPNPNTLGGLTYWYNANGTPDHHHQQNPGGSNLTSLEDCPTGNGNTQCGQPYEGEGVLGCWKGNGPDGTREWGGIQLSEPMVAGGCYEVSFGIQNKKDKLDNEYVSNQWGIFFNHTQTPFFNPNLANYANMADHWVACEEVIDGSEWRKLEFEYQASEDFEYAYIGYMGDFSTSTYSVANDNWLLGYYVWIDEVIVTRIDPQLALTDDISICEGESVLLEATSNFPINWQDTNNGVTSRTVSPLQTTTYYVQTLDSTLCTVLDSVVVTVIGNEEINFAGVDICDGAEPLILDPSIGNGTWSGPGIIDAATGLFDPKAAGVGQFAIQYTSDADCSESFIMNVEVMPPPIIDFEADILEGCPPMEVQFNDISPTTGMTYFWDFGNGNTSNDLSVSSTQYNDLGQYDVSLEVIYTEHCKNQQIIPGLIEVFEHPVAEFTFSPSNPSNLSPQVQFIDASTGNVAEWFWDFGNGSTSDKISTGTFFDLPGIYDVSLRITSINGCIDSVAHQVTVSSILNFYVPNVFSPNDDGINDLFEVYAKGPLMDYKLTIFNRWGGIIYESNNINESWDGDMPSGDKGNTGVFTYSIEYTYQGFTPQEAFSGVQTGDVMILR